MRGNDGISPLFMEIWNGVKRSGHQAYLCIVVDFSICHNCQFLVPAQPWQR